MHFSNNTLNEYVVFQALDLIEMGLPDNFLGRKQTEHLLPIRVLRCHNRAVCGKICALLVHVGTLGLKAYHGRWDRYNERICCVIVVLLQFIITDHVKESFDETKGIIDFSFYFILISLIIYFDAVFEL